MSGGVDAFLKVAVGVSFLLGGFAVSYYFLIYIPERDAALDDQRRQAIISQQYREDRARKAAEEKEAAERAAADFRAQNVQARYEECLRNAMTSYSVNWDTSCRAISDQNSKKRASCTFNKESCDSMYPSTPVKDCSLPQVVAAGWNETLEKARNRCLQESRAGFQ